jgi:hypothetical protein
VAFDPSVNFCIRQIPTARRDNTDTPCEIETLQRRGRQRSTVRCASR